MLNLAHLNNKFVFILEPIATSLKLETEFILAENNTVLYAKLNEELSIEPDYEALLSHLDNRLA